MLTHSPRVLGVGLALALLAPLPVRADTRSDLAQMRQEIDALKAAYEARIQSLETRLRAAEKATADAQRLAQTAAARPATPSETPTPAEAAPVVGGVQSSEGAFNPGISLVLSGLYARTTQDPTRYAITGFAVPEGTEIGPGDRGFSLAESELGIAANIDPDFRGALNFAMHPDNTVSVEEAYIKTLGLSHGLTIKAGRFFSGIGYLNEQHAHTWDFVDSPLAYQAMLGGQYGDDGIQVRWLAPTDIFLELGGELGRGRNYPGSDTGSSGAGAKALFAHVGGDVGDSHSWRAGLSVLAHNPQDQRTTVADRSGADVTNAFSGRSRVWLADFIWKWAPHGDATVRSFKLQGEYLRRQQSGSLTYAVDGVANAADYRSTQAGGYLQGVYQFMPRWRLGARTDWLQHGTVDYGANSEYLTASGYNPTRNSLMFDYSPSEFSRIRLQFSRDRARQDAADNQAFLQYQMSLGAHGAHLF